MRFLAILPILCLTAAFILSMLVLFAGSRPGFLEQYDLLTLNTSQIGQANIQATLDKLPLDPTVETAIRTFVENNEDLAQGIVRTVARELNIKDFYSMHVLDYCEGSYEPTGRANASFTPSKNTTFCSPTSSTFTFNITEIIQSEIRAPATLGQLDWPQDIQNALDALNYATRAMFVVYCVGIGVTGLALLGAVAGFFAHGVLHAWLNGVLDLVAFILIGVASALATAIAIVATNAVNQNGASIGVAAYRGNRFLALTWAATALVFVAMFTWIFDCCAGRRKQRRTHKV